jgi:hypothetical protein
VALLMFLAIAYQAPGDGPDDGSDVIFPDFPAASVRAQAVREKLQWSREPT